MYYRDLKLGILDEKLNSSACRCIAAASAMATMYDAEKPAIGYCRLTNYELLR